MADLFSVVLIQREISHNVALQFHLRFDVYTRLTSSTHTNINTHVETHTLTQHTRLNTTHLTHNLHSNLTRGEKYFRISRRLVFLEKQHPSKGSNHRLNVHANMCATNRFIARRLRVTMPSPEAVKKITPSNKNIQKGRPYNHCIKYRKQLLQQEEAEAR